MLGAGGVQHLDQRGRRQAHPVDGDGDALLEANVDLERLVRRLLRGDGPLVHRLVRLEGRILQRAAFVRQVPQIPVAAVDRTERGVDRDVMGLGIGDLVFA